MFASACGIVRVGLWLGLLVTMLVGCGGDDGSPPAPTVTPLATATSTPTPLVSPVVTPTIEPSEGCRDSGGQIATRLCCASSGDYPSTCRLGVCGCSPSASRELPFCECGEGRCFDGSVCVTR